MKPDWKDAPIWAKWVAMDENGEWWWYESAPEVIEDGRIWYSSGQSSQARLKDWKTCFQARP